MIFVECYADVALVEIAGGIPRENILHELQGKGGICKQLDSRTPCSGMVDEDPASVQPPFVRNARILRDYPEYGIRVLYGKDNYLVVIRPRLEEWVLQAASLAGIDVRTYDLPDNAKDLHRVINTRLDKYRELLRDLIARRSPMLETLKTALSDGM